MSIGWILEGLLNLEVWLKLWEKYMLVSGEDGLVQLLQNIAKSYG